MTTKNSVAAIIVTFNRKDLLLDCIQSVIKQSRNADLVFIIDNFSTDGTPNMLHEAGIIPFLPEKTLTENRIITNEISSKEQQKAIEIIYVRKYKNDGSAGGFNEGMKLAYEKGFDWVWLMDDDGIPANDQLEKLLKYSIRYDLVFSNALVINKEIRTNLAFGLGNYTLVNETKDSEVIFNQINPFNGTFIHRDVISKIGLVKKEMFIWGDESEYLNRAKKNGFRIATIVKAEHYHPAIRGKTVKIIPFINKGKIMIKPQNLAHIFYRNLGYIHYNYFGRKLRIRTYISYSAFYIFRFKFKSFLKFIHSYTSGINNDFKQ